MNEDEFHALLGAIVGAHFPKERSAFALGGKRLVSQIFAQNEAGTKTDPDGTLATMMYALVAWCTFPVLREVAALAASKVHVDEAVVAEKWAKALSGGWLTPDIAAKIIEAHAKTILAASARAA
ncbi:MAG: hypothetical protein ABIP89_01925 [Polyangiaceae bacterium]